MVPATVFFLMSAVPVPSPGLSAQEEVQDEEKEKSRRQKRKEKRAESGTRTGAMAGALAGLALGAAVGEAGTGLAVGAAYGAAAGSMYDYGQSRQDDRTEMIAGGLAGRPPGESSGGGETGGGGETVGDVGRRQMGSFAGDWKVDIWGLAADGSRLTAHGTASGMAAGDNGMRILFREVEVEGRDEKLGGGSTLITYDPAQGFYLENNFGDETLHFVGEYQPDRNAYMFYLSSGDGGSFEGGILYSSVRVELRIASPAMFIAEAFTLVDGKEVQIQQYRFTKS
jgi:hypothetical protein